jgi:hypothetical protein
MPSRVVPRHQQSPTRQHELAGVECLCKIAHMLARADDEQTVLLGWRPHGFGAGGTLRPAADWCPSRHALERSFPDVSEGPGYPIGGRPARRAIGLRSRPGDFECQVERTARSQHPQVLVEHEKGLADGVNDRKGERSRVGGYVRKRMMALRALLFQAGARNSQPPTHPEVSTSARGRTNRRHRPVGKSG